MRVAIAVVIGLVILGVGFATLRGFAGPRTRGPALPTANLLPPGLRIVFWCDTCGTEVLLLRTGTEQPPRHCGEPMTKREEVTPG